MSIDGTSKTHECYHPLVDLLLEIKSITRFHILNIPHDVIVSTRGQVTEPQESHNSFFNNYILYRYRPMAWMYAVYDVYADK